MINVLDEIRDLADPKYDDFNRRLIPGIGKSYGVRIPQLRELANRIAKDDWKSFLSTESTCFEEDILRGLVISKIRTDMNTRMGYVRDFVPTIDNWAVCDIFCSKWKSDKDMNLMWDYCLEQIKSGEEFRMRFSVVMMMANFMDDDHIDMILELVSDSYNPGYYYKMGAAWCLSTCYIKYKDKTEKILRSKNIDKEILGKCIQKICDSYRVDEKNKNNLRQLKRETLNKCPRSS